MSTSWLDSTVLITSHMGTNSAIPRSPAVATEPIGLLGRVLEPAAVDAGLGESVTRKGRKPKPESWVGCHTFRHTCATILFRRGWNAPQVQRFLGHSDPAFTLRRYVHLLDSDLPETHVLRRAGDDGR